MPLHDSSQLCLCMHVCMYMHVCAWMCVHVCIYMHDCVCVHVRARRQACVCVCVEAGQPLSAARAKIQPQTRGRPSRVWSAGSRTPLQRHSFPQQAHPLKLWFL